jgi:hypothetical protein
MISHRHVVSHSSPVIIMGAIIISARTIGHHHRFEYLLPST